MRADLPRVPGVLLIELQHRKLQGVHAGHVLLHPLTLERAIVQLMDDDRGHTEIPRRVPTDAARDRGRRVIEQGNDGVRVEEIPHQRNTLRSPGRSAGSGCSRTATTKSSSTSPTRVSSHSHDSGTGSSTMARPRRRIRTSPASTRKARGSLTACDRPDQKTLAVSTTRLPEMRYTKRIYHSRGLRRHRVASGRAPQNVNLAQPAVELVPTDKHPAHHLFISTLRWNSRLEALEAFE